MDDRTVFFIMTSVILFFVLGAASAGIWLHMRRKYISFAEETCRSIDAVLNGKSKEAFDMDRDTLLSKVQMKFKTVRGYHCGGSTEKAKRGNKRCRRSSQIFPTSLRRRSQIS